MTPVPYALYALDGAGGGGGGDITAVNAGTGRRLIENDGFSANAQLTHELGNGNIVLYSDHVQSTNTARTEVGFDRSLTLPAGTLAFGAGVSTSDTGNSALIGSLAYSNQVPSGVVTARLDRTATVNSTWRRETRPSSAPLPSPMTLPRASSATGPNRRASGTRRRTRWRT